eukprot:21058_1
MNSRSLEILQNATLNGQMYWHHYPLLCPLSAATELLWCNEISDDKMFRKKLCSKATLTKTFSYISKTFATMVTQNKDKPVEETKTEVPIIDTESKPSPTLTAIKTKTSSTKKVKSTTDSDSDGSELEEEREREVEERKKLIAETEAHKQKMLNFLYGLFGIESVICALLLSPPSETPLSDDNHYFASRIHNFTSDTMDVVLISALRLLLLYGFVQLIVIWGNVKTYDADKDKHTIFNTDASHYKLLTKIKGSTAYILLLVWNRLFEVTHNASSMHNDSFSSLLFAWNEGTDDDQSLIHDKKRKIKRLFSMKELVKKYTGMDAQDVADLWKNVLWMMLFFAMTMFTTIIGIKISFFKCANDNDYYYYVVLFVIIVILTHSQSYFVKQYIDDCCKPENRYLDVAVHPHPMFKTVNRGRSCQLCYLRPGYNSTEKKMIFKCLRCPQHRAFVCLKCWEKKRKEARKKEKDKEKEDQFVDAQDVTFKEYFMTLIRYHLPYIHLLVVGMIAMGLQSVINVFVPRQKGQLLDHLISGDLDGFYFAIKMQIVLTVVTGVIGSVSSGCMSQVSEQITCDLQKQLFAKLMTQDMVFFDNHTTNEINERMNWGLSEMLSPFQSTIRSVLSSSVTIFGALSMCLSISWRLTFLGLSTLGPMSYFKGLFSRWTWQRNMIQTALQREMYRISYMGFEHIRSVRAFAKEYELARYYSMLRQESHDANGKKRVTQSVNGIINSWFTLGTKFLLSWVAGMIILNKADTSTTLTVGLFITFETYWRNLYSTIRSLRGTYSSYDRAFFMAKKIFRTLDEKTQIENFNPQQNATEPLMSTIDGNIKFENVEFFYDSSPNKLVLKSINLEIERGKTTALVGRSGGGKSTIMHLILRFYDPSKGRITINGVDLKQFNPYALRRQIALVAQDTELFTKSVEYNIGFGASKVVKDSEEKMNDEMYESAYNLQEIEYAAKLANAHKFIADMEDKYETQMGTRAKRCSGGQKQRISIARMLMSKPSVMLLDEATSSLDAESEALVQAAMERESEEKNCTLVIVAHRLSTVVNADKICVVDDGQIVEEGTHEELIDLKGIYASLVERQVNLRSKMKRKLDKMKNGEESKNDGDDDEDDDDFDNIDKLIDQIKADKLKERNEQNENVKQQTTVN